MLFGEGRLAWPVLLRTPLHGVHEAAGATFTDFAGYDMPVHYGSIREEHLGVRAGVGLFDVSHMSNLWIHGPRAAAAIRRVCPFDAEALEEGRGKYTVVLREDGKILDDAFVYRLGPERFMMVPNAGMGEPVRRHITRHTPEAPVDDETAGWAILALQGPRAREVLAAATEDKPPRFHRITPMDLGGADCLVSGTGYTGEKGVELFVPSGQAVAVWQLLMEAGRDAGIRPVGLGARDTLRLEKGYCLAGHEFAGGRTPAEAGLMWLVDRDAPTVGLDRIEEPPEERLWGLRLARGVPRQGHAVLRGGGQVGLITSGTMSPTLRCGIALAYVKDAGEGDDDLEVEIRGRPHAATVVKPPFI